MKKMSYRYFSFTIVVLLYFLQNSNAQTHEHKADQSKVNKAICVLYPTQGNIVSGTIMFNAAEGGVKVVVDLKGLTPGKHGFHIHEFGDCSSVDGTSAGGHYNPMSMQHGAPMDHMRHMGDMGNIEANANGIVHMEYVDRSMVLNGEGSIIGRSVVVHANEDDLKTQPTGNAGARIGCGVIGVAK